jgi:metal-responsive CopG/Arc/MetJ family transcriptional regulator
MGYNRGYTMLMKTAVSIPDDLYKPAEEVAQRLKIARSTLYAEALTEYLQGHQMDGVTTRLNSVYAGEQSVDWAVLKLQRQVLHDTEW